MGYYVFRYGPISARDQMSSNLKVDSDSEWRGGEVDHGLDGDSIA